MTQTFRKTVMATTMLAGFAIFALDAAQAGPNGPSFSGGGSISGFSSMRMDFNRVGGPGRALSRNDLRVVPVPVVKTTEKPKETKSIAKKDTATKLTNVARASSPKSGNAGKGKNDVGDGPKLQIDPAIIEAYGLTRDSFDEFAERLGLGPLTVANLVFPAQGGSFDPPVEIPTGDQGTSDPDELRKRAEGTGGAPGGPDTSKTGWAAGDAWRRVGSRSDGTTTWTHDYNKETDTHLYRTVTQGQNSTVTRERELGPNTAEERVTVTLWDENGNEVSPKSSGESEDAPKEATEKVDQPNEGQSARGLGRPQTNCGPTGCWTSGAASVRQVLPRDPDGSTTTTASRQSPSWATDPSEEGYTGGGSNGGRTGYDPTQEGCVNPGACGGIDGTGNPSGGTDRPGIPEPGGTGR